MPKRIKCLRDLQDATPDVKARVLFRSGDLVKSNKKYIDKYLKKNNITDIIDFRTDEEVKHYPEYVPQGVNYFNYPVLTIYDNPTVTRKSRANILKTIMEYEGGPEAYMVSVYQSLAIKEEGIKNYSLFLKTLLDAKGNVLWHCTQGKDRTGMASTILLLALGIDLDTIKNDYLSFNKKNRMFRFTCRALITCLLLNRKKALSLEMMLSAREAYFDSFIGSILDKYGSFDNYFLALDMSKEDLMNLRKKYLKEE